MKKKYAILPKIPQFLLFRKLNFPKILPLNLTVSVSYRCNSRCKTCNVWKKKTNEFSLEEFDKTFASLKKAPYWLVLSGGEPFLRHDLVDICSSAYHHIEPGIINIPTNGILYNTIPKKVEEILNNCPDSQIIVNLSVDGIGEDHDLIRGIPGNFEKSMKTYDALSALDYPNFSLGIHTVISRFNVHEIPQIYNFFKEKHPDSYITEIAEERVELDTIGANISPTPEEYEESIDFLINAVTHQKYSRISRVTQAFRMEYYNHVKKMLKQHQQIIPCNAGIASAHIAPDGDVWTCCIRADPVGNLRDVDYDFKKIWFNDRARKQRASIKNKECCCPLANAHYTNMLCDLGTLMRVGSRYLMGNFNRR